MSPTGQPIPGLVSVIICAWNNWPDLEMTIESALHQSYQPVEVIVVDNSSTDATAEEVPRCFGNSVRYIRQPNRGDAGAYNTGFTQARGEFIQFVDGDDVLAPNKLQKQVAMFRANPELDIVYGDIRAFQTPAGRANWTDDETKPHDDILMSVIGEVGLQNTLGKLFRRRALERVGPWDETLYVADFDYWLRAAYAGCRFGHCAGSLMGFYRIRPGQMSENAAAMEDGTKAVWEKALGYVTREPHRSLIAAKVAMQRFYRAVHGKQTSTAEALNLLASARATSPAQISPLLYAMGWIAIVVPGGALLANSEFLRPMRRLLARLVRFHTALRSI